ncbi:MAG: hypothetical protein ACQEXJ_12770 [Myxococcota bacterium]
MSRRRVPRLGWRGGRFLAAVFVMAALTAAGIYQVHQRYQVVRLGYALDDARFDHQRLLEQRKRLRLALSTYKDPVAVRELAREHLDMKEAEPRDELIVPEPDHVRAVPLKRLLPIGGDEGGEP